MLQINVQSNLKAIEKKLSAFAYQQVPFATAQALTALGQRIAGAEQANEAKVLDRPKPFTRNAIGVMRANKARMTATVFMKDITARYLEPYEFGGRNALNARALLKPIDAVEDLDQYGNLPRNFIKKMKGRSDVFIGAVKTKTGVINGVWQRTVEEGAAVQVRREKVGVLKIGRTRKGLNTSGGLKLLVRFTEAHEVRQRLDWFGVAQRVVNKEFDREFGKALARAMATAR
jgi:hypothetical protein